MSDPLVSICLPNLNTLPYLQERVDSIVGQKYANWELIVSDNHSDDGAWEFFEKLARRDNRVSIAQAPREGMYANWNRCLARARGELVYIATSDDGMAVDCLEKLVAALEQHPDCDVAHCPLVVVDEEGRPLENAWWRDGLFGQSHPALVNRIHVRKAPYDGLLCLLGQQVYYSITEMLIRRSLFSRIGGFDSRWGAVSDFHWYMRVGLVTNTVHVPDTWASWRVHAKQATSFGDLYTIEHERKVEDMIQDAVRSCEAHLEPRVLAGLKSHWLEWTRGMRAYYSGLQHRAGVLDRRLFQVSQLLHGTAPARAEIIGRIFGKPKWSSVAPGEIQRWLESIGAGPVVVA
jgi:glycosyltransferase involved in cell wall biosynthesis